MVRRMFIHLLAGIILAAGISLQATSAGAQTPPLTNPNPSAAAIALARELVQMKVEYTVMYERLVPSIVENIKNMFLPTNPNLNRPLSEVSIALNKEFEARTTEAATLIARTYAQGFTETELKELLAFYRTALGKKMLATEPVLLVEASRKIQDWRAQFAEQVLERFRVEMKKKGYDL